MKVTKAKGLEPHLAGAHGHNPRTQWVRLKGSLAAEAMHPWTSVPRIELMSFVGCSHVSEPDAVEAPLLWLLSFGAANESDRRRGATRGLSRGKRALRERTATGAMR
jgi:hypothetical protein